MSDQRSYAETSELHEVTLVVCGACLDGAGGECHTPGCAFWMSAAPDIPLRENLGGPMCDAPWQQFVGLDVNHSIQELCQRHAPAEVLERVKDWVAYMERALALNDWRPITTSDGGSDGH